MSIKIKEILFQKPDEYNQSLLKIEISNNIHYSLINSLRRTCYSEIPIYAFEPENIIINKNDSIDNNTKLKCTLSQLPILNIYHDVKYLDDFYYKNKDVLTSKHPKDNQIIEYYLNVKNETIDNIFVSTENIDAKINNEKVKMYFNTPVVLSQLRPNEELEFSMKASCSIGMYNSIFNSSHTYTEEINDNKFVLNIESYGQMDEYEILLRALNILKIKFENLLEKFKEQKEYFKDTTEFYTKFYIDNENEITFGPMKYFLKKSNNIKDCGFTLYDGYMNDKIMFYIEIKKREKKFDENEKKEIIFDEIFKSLNNCVQYYDEMNKIVMKMKK